MQSSNDVYKTPESRLEEQRNTQELELASELDRLRAFICDALVYGITLYIIYSCTEFYYFKAFANIYTPNSADIPSTIKAMSAASFLYYGSCSLVAFCFINGYWLAQYGQTIGKRYIGIAIISYSTNTVPPLWRILLLRYGPVGLFGLIPGVGHVFRLVDALFIFGKERRCLHDYIANTKVVQVR